MTESSWEFGNDWKSLRGDYPHVCLIELDVEARRGDWFYLHVALLGFRATYTRWRERNGLGDVIAAALSAYDSAWTPNSTEIASYIADEEGREQAP